MSNKKKVEKIVERFKDLVSKHEEFERFYPTETYDNRIDVSMSFERCGKKIFRFRCGVEDDDNPELVGRDFIDKAIHEAVDTVDNVDVEAYIVIEEKGWLRVEFYFKFH